MDTLKAGMSLLCDAFGRDRTDALLDAYYTVLAEYPDRHFLAACRALLAREAWMPPPALLVEELLALCPPDDSEQLALAARNAAIAADQDARIARLAALGLTTQDQATWLRIAQSPPALPPLFRDALFYAPRPGVTPAVIIFADRGGRDRARNPEYETPRRSIAARVARMCGCPLARVAYVDYDELLQFYAGDITEDMRRDA